MACPRCNTINESVDGVLRADHSPSYSQLLSLLQEIRQFTSATYTDTPAPHRFFALNDTILAAVSVVYFKNKAREFRSVCTSFFGLENELNRITEVDPFIGFDVISANLSTICLTLQTANERGIHSISYGYVCANVQTTLPAFRAIPRLLISANESLPIANY